MNVQRKRNKRFSLVYNTWFNRIYHC